MSTLLLVPLALWALAPERSWLRSPFEDAFVVARSEQIVVGHLQEGSIHYVEHPRGPGDGLSYEHLVTLVVTQVLRGNLATGAIPLTIHYGLTPQVVDADNRRGDALLGAIEIWDTGNSGQSSYPLVQDARQNHLWFLRKRGDIYGRSAGVGPWGIVDPEDVSPLAAKEVYLAHLSGNPEARLEELSAQDPAIAKRCEHFLHPPDLKKILAEDHPYVRAEQVLLFLIKTYRHRREERVRADLEKAGAELARLFDHESQVRTFWGDLMMVWGNLRYEPGVPLLLGVLRGQDAYWATQKLDPVWSQTDVRMFELEKSYAGEARCAMVALGRIGAPAARQDLEAARGRWVGQGPAGGFMVRECEDALRALPPK